MVGDSLSTLGGKDHAANDAVQPKRKTGSNQEPRGITIMVKRKKVDEAVVDDIVVYIRHYFEDTGMLPNAREYEDLVQAAQQTARVEKRKK
jgi:hypothetical protein